MATAITLRSWRPWLGLLVLAVLIWMANGLQAPWRPVAIVAIGGSLLAWKVFSSRRVSPEAIPEYLTVGGLAAKLHARVIPESARSGALWPFGNVSSVRLEGEVRGLPLVFELVQSSSTERTLSYAETHSSFACRLAITPRQPFPRFEIIDRHTAAEPALGLPEVAVGRASVNRSYRVFTRQPALSPVLAERLPSFDACLPAGLILRGDGETVSAVFRDGKRPHYADALANVDELCRELVELATAVGG